MAARIGLTGRPLSAHVAGMTGLRDRHVLVTGAASGIGEAVVERLAREGARVALVDRDVQRLDAVRTRVAGGGAKVAAFPTDVGDEAAVRAAVDGAVAALGALRGVITCAGIFDPGD